MAIETPIQGSLFSNDFLLESITQLPDWKAIDDSAIRDLETALKKIFAEFPEKPLPMKARPKTI